jgi:hypothetical protein
MAQCLFPLLTQDVKDSELLVRKLVASMVVTMGLLLFNLISGRRELTALEDIV